MLPTDLWQKLRTRWTKQILLPTLILIILFCPLFAISHRDEAQIVRHNNEAFIIVQVVINGWRFTPVNFFLPYLGSSNLQLRQDVVMYHIHEDKVDRYYLKGGLHGNPFVWKEQLFYRANAGNDFPSSEKMSRNNKKLLVWRFTPAGFEPLPEQEGNKIYQEGNNLPEAKGLTSSDGWTMMDYTAFFDGPEEHEAHGTVYKTPFLVGRQTYYFLVHKYYHSGWWDSYGLQKPCAVLTEMPLYAWNGDSKFVPWWVYHRYERRP